MISLLSQLNTLAHVNKNLLHLKVDHYTFPISMHILRKDATFLSDRLFLMQRMCITNNETGFFQVGFKGGFCKNFVFEVDCFQATLGDSSLSHSIEQNLLYLFLFGKMTITPSFKYDYNLFSYKLFHASSCTYGVFLMNLHDSILSVLILERHP